MLHLIDSEAEALSPRDKSLIKVFDFDGTLCSKNALHLLVNIKFHNMRFFFFIVWYLYFLVKIPYFIILHLRDSEKFNRFLYGHYKGLSLDYLEIYARKHGIGFFRDNLYIDGLFEIYNSKQAYIISANLNLLLKPFFNLIGIPSNNIFANTLEFDSNNICTGNIVGQIVDHYEKQKIIQQIKLDNPDSTIAAFGNSKWDIPMLSIADKAFCINPNTSQLKQFKVSIPEINNLVWSSLYFKNSIFFHYLCKNFIVKFMCKLHHINSLETTSGIIIANHQSWLDSFIVGALVTNNNCCFMAKQEHFIGRLSRWFHSLVRVIPVDRKDKEKSKTSLLIAVYAVLLGLNIVIYPEGTRNNGKIIKQFKYGFTLIAKTISRAKVIPITIKDSYLILPKGKLIPKLKYRASVIVHDPIILKAGRFDQDKLVNECYNLVSSAL